MKTLIIFLALGSVAFADPLDVITLTDGTILRGQVTVLKPGDHVEMVLLDQRTQSIAWNEMAARVGPSFPCDPVAELQTPGPGRVPLHVDSTEPGQLQVGDVPACATTPCTIYVPPGDVKLAAINTYSDPCPIDVDVPPSGEAVTLHPVSASYKRSGVALIIASIGLSVAGATTAGIGAGAAGEPHVNSTKGTHNDDGAIVEGVGGAIAGVGLSALIGGIVLLSKKNTAETQPLDGAIHF